MTSMLGQKTSMRGHHSLPAHFVAVHVAHADQMQGHDPQLSILITKTSIRAGKKPQQKEHMIVIEQQQNKHVLQLLPTCSLGSSTRCSC
jgi:mannitol/fructose-specific phosphotransferase system IIA component (Ntr-type)